MQIQELQPSDIRKYIGKLEPAILDSKIKFLVNVVFRRNKKNMRRRDATQRNTNIDLTNLPLAPIFDSETGEKLDDKNLKIKSESTEHSIFLMQRLRIGQSE